MQECAAGKFHFEPPFTLFNHLVGDREQRRRHMEAERLGCNQVHDQVELGRLLDREVCRIFALENPARINSALVRRLCSVAYFT
jgi:hypothetical protein